MKIIKAEALTTWLKKLIKSSSAATQYIGFCVSAYLTMEIDGYITIKEAREIFPQLKDRGDDELKTLISFYSQLAELVIECYPMNEQTKLSVNQLKNEQTSSDPIH